MEKDNDVIVYEVLFSGKTKNGDGDTVLIGPFMVQSKLREVAIAKAAIENVSEFKDIKLTSLKVKVRGF